MDWITTSGRTLDEAKSHALDQLGIVADEAEFDVINDVEKGLFGRVKSEAKIRARVRPKQTAVKEDRGRRRSGGGAGGNSRNRNQKGGGKGKGRNGDGGRAKDSGSKPKSSEGRRNSEDGGKQSESTSRNGGNKPKSRQPEQQGNNKPKSDKASTNNNAKKDTVDEHMNRDDQERAAQEFLEGVLGAFQMTGTVAVAEEAADDDAIEMVVTGDELGLLVGQKGVTLNAVQELTRTVVQRRAEGAKTDRLRVDVAGYRARRTAALQSFAAKIAEDVLESGTEKLLEPMGPADRKVVHDAVNAIDGVETGSEGEEPRRRVVIRPV